MAPYSLAIEFTPDALRHIVDAVSHDRYTDKLGPDRFNLIEMVAHLADWEDLLLDRMRLALEHPGSAVTLYDEGDRAIEKHYSTRDIQHELDVFQNRRNDTMEFLRSLSPEQFSMHFVHPERGNMTILDQLMMFLGHDIYHLEQATQYLK